jgi:hypothetical protein
MLGVVLGGGGQLLVRLIIFIVCTINYIKLQSSTANNDSVLTLIMYFLVLSMLSHHASQLCMAVAQVRLLWC